MAAKIGLVLALDGEKEFSAGLKAASAAVKEAKAGFEAVKELHKGESNSYDALIARQKELLNVQEALNQKHKAATEGLDNSNARLNKINEQLEHYRESSSELRDALAELESQGKKNTAEYEYTENALRDLEAAEKAERIEKKNQLASYSNWQAALKQTNREMTRNERELERTAMYLREAEQSSDKCATSIDKFGNEIRDISKAKADSAVNALKKSFNDYKDTLTENANKSRELSDQMVTLNAKHVELNNSVKATDIAFEGELNSLSALSAKGKALNDVTSVLKEKQENLAEALKNSEEYIAKIHTQLGTYKTKIETTAKAMAECDQSTKEGRQEYQRLEAELEELNDQMQETANEESRQIIAHGKIYTELSKVNLELAQNNSAISKNNSYLKEAASSADNCATSIDKYGKEAKQAKEAVNVLEETLGDNITKSRELSEALSTLNAKQTEATNSAKAVDIAYKGEANTFDALVAKHEALMQIDIVLIGKQNALSEALKNTEDSVSKIDSKLADYKSKIESTTEAMSKCDRKTKEGREEYQRLETELKELKEGEEKLTDEHVKYVTSTSKLRAELSKVNTDLAENNSAIDKNQQYLDEAEQSADKCANSIDRFGKEVKQAEEEAKSFGDILEDKLFKQFTKEKLIDVAIDAVRRLGQACVNVSKEVVKLGMEYNAQMSKVSSVSNASSKEMQMLDETARQLGRDTVFTAVEAGQGMEELARSGWKAQDIIAGIPPILNLSAASGMDLATSATYISDTLNAFQRPATEASRLTDIFAYAMANSSMTAEDLGEAYGKVASTAAAFGYSEESVTAVLMNMANQGKKAGESGTALSTILTRLATNTNKCTDEVEKYMDGQKIMYDSAGHMRPLEDVLKDLKTVWEGLGEEEQNVLAKTVAGTRQGNALRMVMSGLSDDIEGTGKSFDYYIEGLSKSQGLVEKMAQTNLDNLNGDVTLLNSALSGLGIELEGKLDGSFRTIVQGLTGIINDLTKAIEEPKSELDLFIEEIDKSNDSVETTLNKAKEIASGATSTKTDFEVYGSILMDLNDKTVLTTQEQYALKSAVDHLSGSVPGLAEAFNEEKWSLELTNSELESMLNNAEKMAVMNALMEAQAKIAAAQVEADINLQKSTIAKTEALDEYNAAVEKNGGQSAIVTPEDEAAISKYTTALERATAEEEQAQKNKDDLVEEEELLKQAISNTAESYGIAIDANGNYRDSLEETGKTAEEVASQLEEVQAFDKYGNDITGLSPEDAEEITKQTEEIIDAYDKMRESVVNSIEQCIDMMDKWSGGDEISVDTIVSNLESQKTGLERWKDDLVEIASHVGDGMSEEMYTSLVELGPQSANMIHTIAEAAREQGESDTGEFERIVTAWEEAMQIKDEADLIAAYTEQGQALVESEALGMTNGRGAVIAAREEIDALIAESASGAEADASDSGESLGESVGDGASTAITEKASEVESAATSMVQQAKAAANAESAGASSIGSNIVAGVIAGMASGSSSLAEYARGLIRTAKAAMQSEAQIQSPSKVFKNEVGKYISLGVAFGIKDNTNVAKKAAENLSKSVLKSATNWLATYKSSHKTSLEDEKYYWEEVLKHVKQGTSAYATAEKKIAAIKKQMTQTALVESGFSQSLIADIEKKVDNNFGVSRTTGKKKKKKDDETYYSEILRAAQKYAKNQNILNEWSTEQQLAYYEKVQGSLKKYTQAWYDATAEVNDLRKEISEAEKQAEEDARKTTKSNQDKILDYYKVFKNVSLRAEMQYWDMARKQIGASEDEHIEADKNYVQAREAYYEALRELDENYQSDYEDIVSEMEDTVEELQNTYREAVKSRKEDILSSMDLFEAFDAEGHTGDVLIENLKSQVEALGLWEEKLAELKARGISEGLYSYLMGEGVDAAANVYAISQMTDEQLKQYEELYKARERLAEMQATEDNKSLLDETNKGIKEASQKADDALKELNAKYKSDLAEISGTISSELTSLLSKAPQIAEEAVSNLFSSFSTEVGYSAYKLDGAKATINSSLYGIVEEAQSVGTNAVKGLMQGLQDMDIIQTGAQETINQVKRALQEAAQIHSPSKLFRDEIGVFLGLGIKEGLEDTQRDLSTSAENVVSNMIANAQKEFDRKQRQVAEMASSLNSGGVRMLNELTGTYSPNTVVNVDNSSVASQMAIMFSQMSEMMNRIMNMQVVMDSGELVGAIAPGINREMASEYRSSNRGAWR